MVKIFVGNLADEADQGELKNLFEKFGTVTECDILRNFGFVHMASEDEAETAIAALAGYTFYGSKMNVEMSHGKNSRGGGARGGGMSRGGGFRGSRGSSSSYGDRRGGRMGGEGGYSRGSSRGMGRGRGGMDRSNGFGPDRSRGGDYGGSSSSRYEPYEAIGRLNPLDRMALEDFLFERRLARIRTLPPDVSRQMLANSLGMDSGSSMGSGGGASSMARDPYERPPPEYYSRSTGRSRAGAGDSYGMGRRAMSGGMGASSDMGNGGYGSSYSGGSRGGGGYAPY